MDVPIERSGLGTVAPLNVVDVKARVDGQIQRIAFTEGQEVKVGDLLAQIDPRPYQAQVVQAQAMLAKDSAQLANAKADEARAQKLTTTGSGTVQAADTARAQVAVSQAVVAGDEAAINSAKLNLDFTTLTAPISGRVGLRQQSEGAMIHATDTSGLVTITQMRPIAVQFALRQAELPDLVAGQAQGQLPVSVDSADGSRHLADGKLAVIDSQVDTETGMIKLKAVFDNGDGALWPGQLVTARILVKTDRSVTVVPSGAVQNGQNGPYIFVINPDSTAAALPVTTGPTAGGMTALLSGTLPGQDIVLDGQSRLTDGTKVAARPQAASTPTLASTGNM
jgi:multidrug efflux system membrane fusion protein